MIPPPADRPPADAPVRVAVIGAGRWGRLHAAKLAELPGARLVAVVDRDAQRARRLAAEHGVRALTDVCGLPADLDAATVAVDLPRIAPLTARLLERDLHVLAEKPLALDGATARALAALAARRRRVLAVGYLERFAPSAPHAAARRFVAHRTGPGRSDAPLWLDWMVHDLDHALRLLGPGLRPVMARFAPGEARLILGDGAREARIVAAHRGPRARRRLWVDGLRVDLAPPDAAADPLADQLAAFCAAAAGAAPGRLATADDAAAVLDLLDAARAARPAA